MALDQFKVGTKAVDTTEWSISDATTNGEAKSTATPIEVAGVFQVFLDLNDMIAGDQLQIRIYEKVAYTTDTQRIVYQAILTGAQSEPMWVSPSLMLMNGWDVTLDALAGTITVNWSIRQAY